MIRERTSRRPPRWGTRRRLGPALAALLLFGLSARADDTAAPSLADHLPEAVAAAQKRVAEIRGVPFSGTVPSALLPEKDLPKILERKLVEDLPTSFDQYAATLVAIGLVDPTPDLLKKLVRLYSRQVAGFYDPAERKFYVVPERSAETAAQVPELGLGVSAGDMMEEALLTHELTHALQDRRLDLDRRMKALKSSTDALLALEAFLEGEATVVMMDALVSRLPEEARAVAAGALSAELSTGLAAGANVEGSEGLPEFFVKELLFPYAGGTAYVEKLRARGGWKAVDEAYRKLPASTSQILHPERAAQEEKRLAEKDLPKTRELPEGAHALYTDTLGEWTLKALLERAGAGEAAGTLAARRTDDRVLFFETAGGAEHVGFVWRIRCATPAYAGRPAPARPAIRARGDVVELARGLPEKR